MTVWLYDAHGPERSESGVTDDDKRIRKLAREALASTGASEVLIEQAVTELGIRTLKYGYERTGLRWRGYRTPRGRVTWRRLTAATAPRRAAS